MSAALACVLQRIVWRGVVWYTATNVTGSQTSDVAVGGDVVNYTCQISFYSNTHWSFLSWSTAVQSRVSSSTNTDTIDLYISSIMVKIPEGPATVNRTCYVNYGALSSDYFWQSAVIDVSCECKMLSILLFPRPYGRGNKRCFCSSVSPSVRPSRT